MKIRTTRHNHPGEPGVILLDQSLQHMIVATDIRDGATTLFGTVNLQVNYSGQYDIRVELSPGELTQVYQLLAKIFSRKYRNLRALKLLDARKPTAFYSSPSTLGFYRVRPQQPLVPVLKRDGAPDQAEQQVDMAPVVDVDEGAEPDIADEGDIGAQQIGLPRPVAQQDAESG